MAGTVVILVMLSLLGSVSFALEGVRQLDGQDKATWYAQRLLEGIRERRLASGMGFNDPTGTRVPIDAAPFNTFISPDADYTRRIVTTQLAPSTADYRHDLYRIEVTVYWKTKRRENSFKLVGLSHEP